MSLTAAGSADAVPHEEQLLVIDAAQPARWFEPRDIWKARELIAILAARDIKVRYRQALVGIVWVVLQPVVETFVFGVLFALMGAKPVSAGVPYIVSAYCGLLLWQLFASIVLSCTNSLVENRQLLTKVYFPRVVLPLSAALRPLVDFAVGSVVLVVLFTWYRIAPGIAILVVPFVVLVTLVAALALGLWLSALNAHYRDFGFVVPFVLRIGLFVSPVFYETVSLIPERWRLIDSLNPMVSILGAFRWCLLGTPAPQATDLLVSAGSTAFVLLTGAWYFRRVERFLSDWI